MSISHNTRYTLWQFLFNNVFPPLDLLKTQDSMNIFINIKDLNNINFCKKSMLRTVDLHNVREQN